MLKILAEHNIPIDIIAGTSAGSVVAGAYAAGMTPDQIAEMGRGIRWGKLSRVACSIKGLLSNSPLGHIVRINFPAQRFEETIIPFGAVACDVETGKEIVLTGRGDLAEAIRASCAIPGIFTPVKAASGLTLVDGGAVAPVPVNAVREMGADIVIAVDVLACGSTRWRNPRSAFGVVFQSAMMLLRATSALQTGRADIAILPQVAHLRIDDLTKMKELIAAGEEAAREKIDEIRSLIDG